MKHMKRFMALFAALALVLAMAVPAFAESGTTSAATTGTITVDNAVRGTTYKIYRIFELESFSGEAYSYKPSTAWSDFKEYSTTIDDTTVKASDFFTVNNNGYVEWKDEKKNDGATFAKLAKAYAAAKLNTNDGEETAAGSTVTFSGLPMGYYLLDSSLGALCSLKTSTPNVTIKEKNSDTTTDKKIVENGEPKSTNSASIGDTVNYKTTINVKDGDPQKYVLHDKMSGLNFDSNSVEVRVTGTNARNLTKDTDYTVATSELNDDCTFHINFIAGKLNANDVVEVTYSAKVAASAVIGGSGNKNETHLDYGEDKHTTPSETKTYVWSFAIHKYTQTGETQTQLAGAKFVVYRTNDSKTEYAKFTSGKLSGWTEDQTEASVLESQAKADTVVSGLGTGTYYLKETEAPKGYNKLVQDIKIEISANQGSDTTEWVSSIKQDDAPITGTIIKVLNNAGTVLPGTGGIGTTIFYLIGGGLMVAAAVLLIAKKRMENK